MSINCGHKRWPSYLNTSYKNLLLYDITNHCIRKRF